MNRGFPPPWLEGHKTLGWVGGDNRRWGGSFKINCQCFILLMTVLILSTSEETLVNSEETPSRTVQRTLGTSVGKEGMRELCLKKSNLPKQLIILLILKKHFWELFASKYSKCTILLLVFITRML